MYQSLDVVTPPAPVAPTAKVHLETKYIVVARNQKFFVFDTVFPGGNNNRMETAWVPTANGNQVYQFIDPLSALWMGLVTVKDLGLSENTVAVLKLAMDDLLP